jgi:hypothetical protein
LSDQAEAAVEVVVESSRPDAVVLVGLSAVVALERVLVVEELVVVSLVSSFVVVQLVSSATAATATDIHARRRPASSRLRPIAGSVRLCPSPCCAA